MTNLQLNQMQEINFDSVILTVCPQLDCVFLHGQVKGQKTETGHDISEYYLFTQKNELREFKSIDAAYKVALTLWSKRVELRQQEF